MDNFLKSYLFNHNILVCEEKETPEIAFSSRYLMEKSFGVRIAEGEDLATKEMVEFVADSLGQYIPEPFYKGFPESVKALTTDQLLFDQLFHYFKTYGQNDFSEVGHSEFEKFMNIERKSFDEDIEVKNFTILTEKDAIVKLGEYVEEILAGTRPINDELFFTITLYIKEYDYKIQNCASKNLAFKLLIYFRDMYYATFISMSDVIKLVEEMNYLIYYNYNIKKLNLQNVDRKFITKVINHLFKTNKCDIRNCYEKKALWNGLLHHIHYKPFDEASAEFVQAMRDKSNNSVYAEFERALEQNDIESAVLALEKGKGSGAILRNLEYIISRCQSDDDIEKVLNHIDSNNGIVLMQLYVKYASQNNMQNENSNIASNISSNIASKGRIFQFTKYNMLIVHKETPKEVARRKTILTPEAEKKLATAIEQHITTHYQNKLGKVYIDDAMENIALPLQENTSSSGYGVLPRGSRIHIEEGKKIRAFTYWEKVDDIDLSVIGIKKDGTISEFSWRTMWNNQSNALTYSGDETSGYNGGSEYFDVDVELFKKAQPDISHLVFCDNVFSRSTFSKCICRAGYMLRDTMDSGEIYEPKTVKSSFTVACDSRFAYLFAIDLEKNDFIWLNIGKDSSSNIAGNNSFDFLTKYFDVAKVMNYKKFFTLLAKEIVSKEDTKNADIIVSDEYSIDAITDNGVKNASKGNNNVEIIHSYDFEKMIKLLNS